MTEHGLPVRWTREWFLATAGVAAVVTTADAWLLQRKNGLFTGGFLAIDHLQRADDRALFLFGSLLSDAALAGVLITAALWLARTFGFRPAARRVAAIVGGLLPFAVADLVIYQIASYLGDAFDLHLMFQLTGRHPTEILAVASAPALRLGIGLCVVIAATALIVVSLRRRSRAALALQEKGPGWRDVFAPAAVLLLAGAFLTTGMRLDRESLDHGLRRKASGRALGSLVTLLTDFDADGFGLLSRPRDTAPFDARIRPYAIDEPGNGIDEDGVAGDLPAASRPYLEAVGPRPTWQRHPDVVLVLLETFRADIVGSMLNGRAVTPRLDALSKAGAAAAYAYSHNGYTVQSRFHVLGGSLANLRGGTTLIDDFKANGYETGYFSGQDESFGGGFLPTGADRADVFFDARQDRAGRYSDFATPGSLAVPFQVVQQRIAGFLDHRNPARPLFLYVNFHDTHFPYTHRFVKPIVDSTIVGRDSIAPDQRDAVRRMYLNTAANVDAAIGDVIDRVRSTTGRSPAVIVTGDHGESLFDEGFLGHGYALNDAQTRIPLVVAGLPMAIQEPWGQACLRDEINDALAMAPGSGDLPHRVTVDRPVFQYLGSLRTPAKIAFTSPRGRTAYDFRSDRFETAGHDPKPVSSLDPEDLRSFQELVRYWESIVLAMEGKN
jgi:hypothetical protein